MDKKLSCEDMGWNCTYTVCASTGEEAIQKMGEHIQAAHAMKGFSKDFYNRALSSLREGSCESESLNADALCEDCFGTCVC